MRPLHPTYRALFKGADGLHENNGTQSIALQGQLHIPFPDGNLPSGFSCAKEKSAFSPPAIDETHPHSV
jgi:hypothetical protein